MVVSLVFSFLVVPPSSGRRDGRLSSRAASGNGRGRVLWRGCGGHLGNINRVAFKGIIPCRLLPF